jgi:hypothetical protein
VEAPTQVEKSSSVRTFTRGRQFQLTQAVLDALIKPGSAEFSLAAFNQAFLQACLQAGQDNYWDDDELFENALERAKVLLAAP